ncbi:alpha-2-macroglobulin family protein [Pyxidicoccus sp. 3LG]
MPLSVHRPAPALLGWVLTALLFTACQREAGPAPESTPGAVPAASDVASIKEVPLVSLPPPLEPPPLPTPEPVPTEPPAQEDTEAAEELTIERSACAQAECELVLTFSKPMKKEELPATFEPPQKGTWAWRSDTELVFTPESGALGWGHPVKVRVASASWEELFQVPFFQVAGKVASWPVIPGRPRFIAFLNDFTDQVGNGPLLALYDQPVTPKALGRHIKAEDDAGKPVTVKVTALADGEGPTSVSVDTEHVLALRFPRPPAHGSVVTVLCPSYTDEGTEPAIHSTVLTVNRRLTLDAQALASGEDPQRAPLSSQWQLTFNNPVDADALRAHLDVEPAPESLEVSGWGHTATVTMQLTPGQRYRAALTRGLEDVLGNPLDGKPKWDFRAQDLPPVLQLPRQHLTLELPGARLPFQARNLASIDAQARRITAPDAFVKAFVNERMTDCESYGAAMGPARSVSAPRPKALNALEPMEVALESGKPGLYCLQLTAKGRGSEAGEYALQDAALLQLSGLGLTAKVHDGGILVWLTRLADATPVAQGQVTLLDETGARLASAETGADGVALLRAPGVASGSGLEKRVFISARKDEDRLVAEVDEEKLSSAWQFGLTGEVKGAERLSALVFTDRGAYRPEETVHIKALVKDAGRLPKGERGVQVRVQDPRGQGVLDTELTLDGFGTADVDLKLKAGAAVGEYSLRLTHGERAVGHTFRVEEYRVPTFEVKVTGAQPEWPLGSEVEAVVDARYLHGGELSGREVRYQVWRAREAFAPAGFAQYAFGLPDDGSGAGLIDSGEERLDGQGRKPVRFKVDHPSYAGPMRYTVEASVTDVDRQAYAGRLSRVVHPAAFYVGVLPPPRAVVRAGEVLEVPVIAVRPDGTVHEGVQVRAKLERVDHHTYARMSGGSAQLVNREEKVDAGQCLVTTEKTAVTCRLTVPEAGQYQVRAWAQDPAKNLVQAGFQVSASGGNAVAWPRFDQDRIQVVADKARYLPGETARLVVQTPFPDARGLLTVERGGILEHRVFDIQGDTPTLEIPITDAHVPNVYASVVLLRGRVHAEKDATGFETGAPAFKLGYVQLHVEPRNQRLAVEVTPEKPVARPGATVRVDVKVKDSAGRPAAGQATVMVVDEAVLGLTGYRTPDPVPALYVARSLGVRTAESRLELPHARRQRHELLFPGGDGGEGFALGDFPADLRTLFQSTAYWNPRVAVGPDGTASVSVKLPDNLTRYRVMAVVVDAEGRAGSGEKGLVVKKPLMLQPVLPRFAYPGDALRVEVLAFNGQAEAGPVQVTASFEGLELQQGGGLTPPAQAVKPGESASFGFPVKVSGRKNAKVRFAARLGEATDAVEVTLPVLNPGSRRVRVSSAQVSGEQKLELALPADRQPGSVELEVTVSGTALSELKDAVGYLMDYPNGCIEQTTSTAYPLVVLKDLLPEMGVTVDEADLKKFSEAGIKRILSFQTTAGGLSYWPGGTEPHAFATAFGLTALIEGKKRGYDVPDEALKKMGDYLELRLRDGNITEEIPHGGMADADTRAYFVMTLGRLGRPQPAYISTLWREKSKLTAFGLSFLAVAVSEAKGQDQSLLQPILAEVETAASKNEQEAWFDGKPHGGWSMDSPLRTHATALLAFASGGGKAGPVGNKLLTGLLKRQQGGMWGNTQENVFGIMGVVRLAKSAQSGSVPPMSLTLDGRPVKDGDMEAVSQRVRRLRLTEADLGLKPGQEHAHEVLLTNRGTGPAMLRVRAQYEVELNAKNRAPREDGFRVERQYETVSGEPLTGPIALGSLVRVRLKVRASSHQNYVAIDDKLPAGLEPMNTSLATTEKVSQGPLTAALQRGLASLSYSEMRDHRVAFYVDDMAEGDYEFSYVARATTPGTFLRPAAGAEAMYAPEVAGTTAIDEVTVR